MIYSIKDGFWAEGSGTIEGGVDFEGTLEEVKQYIYDNRSLEERITEACDMLQNNYNDFCSQGISYQTYTIDNTKKTRDEIDKKIANVALDIDTSFDWTMDSPREKVVFSGKAQSLAFMEALQCVIAGNETKLRDKKTELRCCDMDAINAFIASPAYPTYEREL